MSGMETSVLSVSPVPVRVPPVDPEAPVWLPHYRPEYDYRPEHVYTETHTTDPYYVVEDVRLMGTTGWHADTLHAVRSAEDWLLPAALPDGTTAVHTSWDKSIRDIPAVMLAHMRRHTASVSPDMAVWRGPTTPAIQYEGSYDFAVWGAPVWVLEVASDATRHVDRHDKWIAYARMGVLEYWRMDRQDTPALTGYTLSPPAGNGSQWPQYRALPRAADGGLASAVLGRRLRSRGDRIQGWHAAVQRWIDLQDLPGYLREAQYQADLQAERVGELLKMADAFGAFASPAVRDRYQAQLRGLTLAQTPLPADFALQMLQYPDGRQRAVAVQRFLDAIL